MMVNRRSLDRPAGRGLASFLRRRGFHVYTLDLRGHGASGPKAGAGGAWTYDDLVQLDLPAALRAVARRHPDLPLAYLGHSLSAHGGAVALGLEPALPVDAVVLVSPVLWVRSHEPSRAWWWYKRGVLAAWWGLTRLVGRTPARRLGIGTEDEAPGYVRQFPDWARRDAWTGRATPAWRRQREGEIGAGDATSAPRGDGVTIGRPGDVGSAGEPAATELDYLAALSRVRGPVLVLNARGDRWVSRMPSVARFAAAMSRAQVELREYGRAELPDMPREPGHMSLVTDPRSWPAWEAMVAWLDEALPAAGAGLSAAARPPAAGP